VIYTELSSFDRWFASAENRNVYQPCLPGLFDRIRFRCGVLEEDIVRFSKLKVLKLGPACVYN